MGQKGGGGPRGQLPLNEETGAGVRGPGVGRRDALGTALPACLDGQGWRCMCSVWGEAVG